MGILRKVVATAFAAMVALVVFSAVGRSDERPDSPRFQRSIAGEFLVATPRMGDPRFARTVIYMVEHDARGALGLIINRSMGEGPLAKLLQGFGVDTGESESSTSIRLYFGGPVKRSQGFIIHTPDYRDKNTKSLTDQVSLSTRVEVLKAVAEGRGPTRLLFVLGYAGWGPGQLEGEMAREDWLTAPFDEELLFGADVGVKWSRAMALAGISL